MKRLVPLLLLLSACTIGQPTGSTPAPPSPQPTLSASPSLSPSSTDSGTSSPSSSTTESYDPSASPSSSVSGSMSPGPRDSSSAAVFRAPGEVLTLAGEVTTTALDSKRAKVPGHRGSQVQVMVKTCNVAAASGIELTWDDWVLLGPDSEEYPASTTKGVAEPSPVYPNGNGRLYKPGQCAKGWIVFDVPNGAALSGVRYMHANGDSGQWRLSPTI